MTNTELVTARDLDAWCTDERSQFTLPIIVRQLILATVPATEITMPARVGVRQRGWDGLVQSGVSDPHVPRGLSGWELGTGAPPRDKAQRDYRNRTRNPCGVDPVTTTFVAVTSRIWSEKTSWRDARRKHGRWADVRAYDALDLEIWMERVPSAHVWISEILGREPRDARTPDAWWTTWSRQTDPALPRPFLLAGRDAAIADLTQALRQPPQVITVTAASQTEALAVVCASLADDGSDVTPFQARALVVSGEDAWGRLVDATAPLVLIPTFEEPDVATALDNGHHVVVPVSRDVPPRGHLVAVPALDRFLRKPSYLRFRAAGGFRGFSELSVRMDELTAPPDGITHVYVIENEITYLAVPVQAGAMVLFGGGYAVSVLEPLGWLAGLDIVYWGDIDTHGFAILNRLRHRLPHARSMLMDRVTLLAHRDRWIAEPSPSAAVLDHLDPAESGLYADLVSDAYAPSIRLEQERIRFAAVEKAIADTLGDCL